jgi:hypothetical protein
MKYLILGFFIIVVYAVVASIYIKMKLNEPKN